MGEPRAELDALTDTHGRLFIRDRTAALVSVPNETLDRYVLDLAYATRRTRAILAKEIGEVALAGLLEYRAERIGRSVMCATCGEDRAQASGRCLTCEASIEEERAMRDA